MNLKVIPIQIIHDNWEVFASFINEALQQAEVTEYTVEQIKGFLTSGNWILIGVISDKKVQGVVVITVIHYPNESIAFVTAISGKLITSKDTFEQLKNICKSYGASKIQGYARDSVARLWHRLGFNNRAILVEAKI